MRPTIPQTTTSNATPPLTAQRVLFIPELLDIIFNFLERKINVINACVCKQWSEIALDVVWKDIDNLIDLFSLLKPIQDHSAEYTFETLPEASDWYRFEKYANRVRSLRFRPECYDQDIIPLLDEVARTRTSLEILPNMHTLEWLFVDRDQMERCKLFLHQRVKHLTVTAPCPEEVHRRHFFTDLCARSPHLQTITLFVQYPGNPIEDDIHILVHNLPELKKIVLPEFHFTSGAIEALSRAKNLGVVDFIQDPKLGYGRQANVGTFCPVLQEGAFPALHDLNLSARIDHLDSFFRSDFAPIHITSLYVNAYADHPPSEIHTFLLTLSQKCQLLSKLFIQLYNRTSISILKPEKQLSYETIQPILTFSKLTSFELVHKYPLKITLDQIEDLATRCPTLESLMLNAEPLFLGEDAFTLDLRAVQPFARHCPRLRRLGLYMNASKVEIPSIHSPVDCFTSLEVLAVGTSQARDTGTVATFLSRVCPPGCKLEVGITWSESDVDGARVLSAELRRELSDRGMGWQTIEKLLPALIELRREEQDRSRALQEEVEDLRVRTRLLMDKADVKTKDSCIIV